MRILYLAHRIPYPPDKGDKLRAFHQVRHLGARHELDLLTLYDDPDDARHVEPLRRYCRRVEALPLSPTRARLRALAAVAGRRPFSPAYFGEPALTRRAAAWIGQREGDHLPGCDAGEGDRAYDAVFLFCSSMGRHLPPAAQLAGIPVVADYCDLDSAKWASAASHGRAALRPVYRHEARHLPGFEIALAGRCAAVVFATPAEVADFVELLPDRDVAHRAHDVANGVEVERFARPSGHLPLDPVVVFTGAMDYVANDEAMDWMLRHVWPAVRHRRPDARLLVVGRDPSRRLRSRDGRDGVTVTGWVDDVRPYLHAARVAVAPLRIARGVQNKVLEAMAAGVPTAISPAAARGLRARDGHSTLVCDSPAEWVAALTRLFDDDALCTRLAGEARRYLAREHSWQEHGLAIESLLHEAVGTSGAHREVA